MKELTTKDRILKVARDEFMVHGFRDASLRRIAGEAGVAVSNIYNHFESKDKLYVAVLQPLLDAWNVMRQEHSSEKELERYINVPREEYAEHMSEDFMAFFLMYREDLKLLLNKSEGSSLENFGANMEERTLSDMPQWLSNFKSKFPSSKVLEFSPLILRFGQQMMFTFLSILVSDSTLSEEDVRQAMRQYTSFVTAGWNALLKEKE